MIEGMINRAEFRFNNPVIIDMPSQLASTTIYLRMKGIHSERISFYPISGFPRRLIAEDKITGKYMTMIMTPPMLKQSPETRLDKRAELIKERRFGGLAIANDPRFVVPSNEDLPPETPPKDDQDANSEGKNGNTLARAGAREHTDASTITSASSQKLSLNRGSTPPIASQPSRGSSSMSDPSQRRVSIANLRAEAQLVAQNGFETPILIDDNDELVRNISGTFPLGSDGFGNDVGEPDLGSDDSDGPPEEGEDEEEEAGVGSTEAVQVGA